MNGENTIAAGEPFDLTRAFGDTWCVSVTPLPLQESLHRMGVHVVSDLPDGLALASLRSVRRSTVTDGSVLLLAKPADRGTTVVLQLEGLSGWIGSDPETLGDLSSSGGLACSIWSDPNRTEVLCAEDGRVSAGLDAVTGRSWVQADDRATPGLASLGASAGADALAEGGQWNSSQRAVLALRTITGVRLSDELCGDPWTGGFASW
ncbi:hypothetical protein [Streptomyces sp. NRRL S-1521]|uniref:hypothetical protein n=1 Tax=Streptomyces sp. NRRL S-1521 TaxID=1609100 RepID=UPI0007493E03|nr:hypothetical protein [Streptomyces sp. NRRL S-1521]KUL63364.1 hypothetical protein ADL30_03555 [Streptomyces sp. NRRL S-1521]